MKLTSPTLKLRSQPSQARSRQTFERILLETAALLEEVGFDAFNTNLLSSRSGIGVRAIYRYFPNKFALVCELARRIEGEWRDALASVPTKPGENPWPNIWPVYLDEYIAAVKRTPGGTAILRAMRSNPDLRAVDDEMTSTYKTNVAQSLRDYHSTLARADAVNIASVLLHSTVAVVDASLDENPRRSKQLISKLKAMHLNFLRDQLSQSS